MYDGVCRSGTRRRRRQTKENSDRHILINFCGISINGICVLKKKISVFESDEEYVIVGRRRQWRWLTTDVADFEGGGRRYEQEQEQE